MLRNTSFADGEFPVTPSIKKICQEGIKPDGKDKFLEGSLTDFSPKFWLITYFLLDKSNQTASKTNLHKQMLLIRIFI